ncbi:uncharacterized protein B0I36DRAFT_319508 [Microdochium trichocladiopsis]|uniref:Uncharacterized protein n=1 Tax=Microdochium trichocladiopsis TaxID=1682393 RepID=A0A9P8YCY9_9PEZI|nr:uncharacterized protein B0I36DRAFT_319508 [Microdochium trichocladiopsis]KAH7035992.1 hypothetical protein B0I36DRAFT_319508 [Microdochium trichocladiopsis]
MRRRRRRRRRDAIPVLAGVARPRPCSGAAAARRGGRGADLGLAKVVLWEPCPRTRDALEWLSRDMGIKVEVGPRGGASSQKGAGDATTGSVTSVRWKGGGNGEGVVLQVNEYYAWSG